MESGVANYHVLSDVIAWYYTSFGDLFSTRFTWLVEELGCSATLQSLQDAIYAKMTGTLERIPWFGLLNSKGGSPTEEVISACCNSFANYVYAMISL